MSVTDAERIETLEKTLAESERAFRMRVAALEEIVATLTSSVDEYKKLVRLLQEENERLKRGLLGQKAERFSTNDAQLSLSMLQMAFAADGPVADEAADPETKEVIAEYTRGKAKRKPLPESLLRVPIEILPVEVQKEGLDAFDLVGSDVREVLERRAAATVVVQFIYKKFVRKDRDLDDTTVVYSPDTVEMPIPRGLAGPGMLADTVVRRWQDHQPLNRLEGIYGREGLELARSTICTWHEQLGELVAPVVEAMFADALREPYLCVDATGVLVLAKEQCRNGHFWVLVAPEKHVLYGYSKRHDSAAVDELLRGYKGYLVADAHTVYDHLFRDGEVIEVACWAHCRRYFFKALASDPERARVALSHIGAIFRLERTIADSPRKKKEEVRRSKARPIVDNFFEWCDAQVDTVLDETPISAGITYARNQRVALQRFLDDGRLPVHNNISELNLRRQVVGRRNWLFVGSDDGAVTNTRFVSLLASARLHDIEPLGYIRDLFCLLPSWPRNRVLELAPAYWQQTFEQRETQEKLAANVFRRVLLDLPR
jgi:transposase